MPFGVTGEMDEDTEGDSEGSVISPELTDIDAVGMVAVSVNV